MTDKSKTPEFDAIQALKRAEKMRIEFVANVSHELRTPLTSIKGYTDTLLQDLEDGRKITPDFLRIISRNVDRVISLINDLLDLSTIESGADQLKFEEIDTLEISQRVLSNLNRALENKHNTVEISADIKSIYADPKRLEQVLTNLVDNANKYCASGSTIKIQWDRDSDQNASLKVTDNGPGISEKHISRLFERFYRVDKGRSRDMGGTGLGLAIVKHIMQRHNGNVMVESIVGSGTTFTCIFPSKPQD